MKSVRELQEGKKNGSGSKKSKTSPSSSSSSNKRKLDSKTIVTPKTKKIKMKIKSDKEKVEGDNSEETKKFSSGGLSKVMTLSSGLSQLLDMKEAPRTVVRLLIILIIY